MLSFIYWLLLIVMFFKVYPLEHESAFASIKLSSDVLLCEHAVLWCPTVWTCCFVYYLVLVAFLLAVMKCSIKFLLREKPLFWFIYYCCLGAGGSYISRSFRQPVTWQSQSLSGFYTALESQPREQYHLQCVYVCVGGVLPNSINPIKIIPTDKLRGVIAPWVCPRAFFLGDSISHLVDDWDCQLVIRWGAFGFFWLFACEYMFSFLLVYS